MKLLRNSYSKERIESKRFVLKLVFDILLLNISVTSHLMSEFIELKICTSKRSPPFLSRRSMAYFWSKAYAFQTAHLVD